MKKTKAILLAAGQSTRMGKNKLLIRFFGKTVLELSFCALCASEVDEIVIAGTDDTRVEAERLVVASPKPTTFVYGGKVRGESVYNALIACGEDCGIVVIHDGARCLVSPKLINESIASATEYGSAIAAVPVRDTLREHETHSTVDRNALLAMQTPQTFDYRRIMDAYDAATCFDNTDDCELYMRNGNTPHYIEGEHTNNKLTYPEDEAIFCAIIGSKETKKVIRVGYGEDTHRLVPERQLILGGEKIDFELGLLGHSDADVLTHSIMDAILGAMAMRDIGYHFPDTDENYKGCNSLDLLKTVMEMTANAGFSVVNIDSTIIAQKPKLAPHIEKMRNNLADAMGIDVNCVSVKATTPEGTNAEGRLECITVRSTVLIEK